jgi:hypothetical protein
MSLIVYTYEPNGIGTGSVANLYDVDMCIVYVVCIAHASIRDRLRGSKQVLRPVRRNHGGLSIDKAPADGQGDTKIDDSTRIQHENTR